MSSSKASSIKANLFLGCSGSGALKAAHPDSSSFFYSKPDGTTYSVDNYYGGHGSITVTSWDKSAKIMVGKFNGVLYNVDNVQDSLKVENGTFNVSYINY